MSTTSTASETLNLSLDLIARRSITPDDAGCQQVIAERLEKLGFQIEHMQFGAVSNLWARHGQEAPLFVFAGHTDVVPPGPDYLWKSPPFKPTISEGMLYGRGAADMKTGIAAMTTAVERFLGKHQRYKGSIALLLTSNEEGDAVGGTPAVIEELEKRKERMDYCLVGEATSTDHPADTIKNGRRGSITARLKIKGVQGHIAYPSRAANPIHLFAPALAELCGTEWDKGNEFFTPTSMQFASIRSGTGVDNLIPGELDAMLNFRFSSDLTAEQIQQKTEGILSKHQLNVEVDWRLSGKPFLTKPAELTEAVTAAVAEVTGRKPGLSTSGGTSDARFIAPTGAQVIELGLVNTTIHKANEMSPVADLDILSSIYEKILERLLTSRK